MKVKHVVIEEANFNLNKKNYDFFIKLLKSNFKDIKFEILDSNIFYRNLENEVLFINNITNAKYIYNINESKNILYSKNNTTLKNETLKTGLINEKDYEKIVDPKKMIYPL